MLSAQDPRRVAMLQLLGNQQQSPYPVANAGAQIVQAMMMRKMMNEGKDKQSDKNLAISRLFAGEPDAQPAGLEQSSGITWNQARPDNPEMRGQLESQAFGPEQALMMRYEEKQRAQNPELLAPVAGADASGNPVFFQPRKLGGAPVIVPGVSPPKQSLDKGTHLSQLISERKALPPNDPLVKIYDQAISKEAAQTGMRITSDGQGGFEVTTGGLEPTMTNPSKTKLEDVILNGRDTLAKMNQIKADFKPEYQQIGTRAEMLKYSAMAKAGVPLDPAAQKSLTDFATYRRNAASNMNTAIKNATGVTVGKDEAPRLMNEIPNPGSGLFDGDDPVSFMAKVDSTVQAITASVARAAYAKKHGLDKDAQFAIPLDSIPEMIRQKGDQYAADLKKTNPGAPDDQIAEMVKARLREEFGL